MPSASEAKKLKFKTITANQSGIVLDIDGYETKYRGTCWNANYSIEKFRAKIDRSNQRLAVAFYSNVLAPGYLWSNTKKGLEAHIRNVSQFKNYIVRFTEKFGGSESGSYDSSNKRAAAKYEISHPKFKTCYFFSFAPHYGESADFNPWAVMEICAKEDLNLSIKNPEKFFIIDDRNEKVRLDLSYQNLGQKIAALKTSTTSTSSSVSSGSPPSDEEVCAKAINPSDPDRWSKKPEDQSYVKQAQNRGYSSDQCHFMVQGSDCPDGSIDNGKGQCLVNRKDSAVPKWPTSTKTEKRPIALHWEGKNQLMIGEVELPVSGANGKVSFSLPDNSGKCSGTFGFRDRSSGVWAAACSTEETLSGSFISAGQGRAITGTGTDREGNAIKFTIGPR
jgi:hypothetical protein